MDINILVASHKPYKMPSDSMYTPVHAGHIHARKSLGWIGDDTGCNISAKNKNFCELTVLYWAWNNIKADALGIAHYRRHFINPGYFKIFNILKSITPPAYQKISYGLQHGVIFYPKII